MPVNLNPFRSCRVALAVGASGMVLACQPQVPDAGEPVATEEVLDQRASFTTDGMLRRPQDWETWVMVGATLGLSYSEPPPGSRDASDLGMFHNVFLQRWAYREFMERGAFPEGSVFVLAMYPSERNASPARSGLYAGDAAPLIEVHAKWQGVDSTGWGFYNFGPADTVAPKVPGSAPCYSCHAAEAAFDHVFTQFYPALRAKLTAASRAP